MSIKVLTSYMDPIQQYIKTCNAYEKFDSLTIIPVMLCVRCLHILCLCSQMHADTQYNVLVCALYRECAAFRGGRTSPFGL